MSTVSYFLTVGAAKTNPKLNTWLSIVNTYRQETDAMDISFYKFLQHVYTNNLDDSKPPCLSVRWISPSWVAPHPPSIPLVNSSLLYQTIDKSYLSVTFPVGLPVCTCRSGHTQGWWPRGKLKAGPQKTAAVGQSGGVAAPSGNKSAAVTTTSGA